MLNHVYSTSKEVIQVSGLTALQGLPGCEGVGGSESPVFKKGGHAQQNPAVTSAARGLLGVGVRGKLGAEAVIDKATECRIAQTLVIANAEDARSRVVWLIGLIN